MFTPQFFSKTVAPIERKVQKKSNINLQQQQRLIQTNITETTTTAVTAAIVNQNNVHLCKSLNNIMDNSNAQQFSNIAQSKCLLVKNEEFKEQKQKNTDISCNTKMKNKQNNNIQNMKGDGQCIKEKDCIDIQTMDDYYCSTILQGLIFLFLVIIIDEHLKSMIISLFFVVFIFGVIHCNSVSLFCQKIW